MATPEAPILVRLLLDAQSEFGRVADALGADAPAPALAVWNSPGWIVAHTSFYFDAWINVDAQGQDIERCDPWLLAWMRRQRDSPDGRPVEACFDDALGAFTRVTEHSVSFLLGLTDLNLAAEIPAPQVAGWPAGASVGYLVARASAHLFAHAAELNVIATAAGHADLGLPGRLSRTFGEV